MSHETVGTTPDAGAPPAERRSLVLVAGSGRSGTSVLAGILQRLGMRVPQPEVEPDETNPRGFAESRWVVDFHTRLLQRAGVHSSDARPVAWALTGRLALDDAVRQELSAFLEREFAASDALVVKDPRLSWFLPLWRCCAEDVGALPRFVTMLRHPAAVVDSKQKWYGGRQSAIVRTAGWVNQVLHTERATRDAPRSFLRYEDLLDDWTIPVARLGEELDLGVVRDAPAQAMRSVQDFIDPRLSRSPAEWGHLVLPQALRDRADAAWALLSELADASFTTAAELHARLDDERAAYIEYYGDAEAIAQSSILAAERHTERPSQSSALRLARRLPARYRHAIPLSWRVEIARSLRRS